MAGSPQFKGITPAAPIAITARARFLKRARKLRIVHG
jgi:hypothetical protein